MSKLLKAQFWYMDFIMGIALFTIVLIIAFRFITSDYLLQGKETDQVVTEADKLSESLLTAGIPLNWTNDTVIMIGISPDNVLNTTKLEQFKNMTGNNYMHTKYILGMKSDFMIFFEDLEGNPINITNQTYIGKPGESSETLLTLDTEDIITITRYIVYRHDNISEIIPMKVIVWQI